MLAAALAALAAILAALAFRDYPRWLNRLLVMPFLSPDPSASAVLITGCSSGLGRHAALWLAMHGGGFTVLATVRKEADADALRAAWTEEVRSGGGAVPHGDLVPIIMDVTSDESVSAAAVVVDEVLAKRGLDLAGVVNNAGVNAHGGVLSAAGSADSYLWNFDVNVFGVVRVTQKFLPRMTRSGKGGRLVNVGSVAGVTSPHKGSPYTATKHALEGMSDSWRRELAEQGVSVSLIQPGFIASSMCSRKICDDAYLPKFSESVLDAVTAPYPKTRYAVANVVVMPAWLAIWLDSVLPDRVADFVVGLVTRNTGIGRDR